MLDKSSKFEMPPGQELDSTRGAHNEAESENQGEGVSESRFKSEMKSTSRRSHRAGGPPQGEHGLGRTEQGDAVRSTGPHPASKVPPKRACQQVLALTLTALSREPRAEREGQGGW